MRYLIFIFLISAAFATERFDDLMGKNTTHWANLKSKEDKQLLKQFKLLYKKNLQLTASDQTKIPKVIHFIWLGPKPFPRESVENVKTWIAKHPDWKVKFWTDRERPLPHPAMERVLLSNFHFLQLADCFNKSDNYGEKSDILRYEILFQEGGIYVDHDVKCIQSFDAANGAYDLFCGLEMPYKTALSSSVLPTNNIVASRAGHPVLKFCLDWLSEKWDQIENDYPGKDRDSVINRVSHRTFLVLGESLKKLANQNGNHDMVFPAFYFNAPRDDLAILSRHQYAGSWFENESAFEKTTRERLMMLSKKTNKILLLLGVMTSLNLIGFASLFILFRRRHAIRS